MLHNTLKDFVYYSTDRTRTAREVSKREVSTPVTMRIPYIQYIKSYIVKTLPFRGNVGSCDRLEILNPHRSFTVQIY